MTNGLGASSDSETMKMSQVGRQTSMPVLGALGTKYLSSACVDQSEHGCKGAGSTSAVLQITIAHHSQS